ncbi:MAG: hypothetical protein ACRCZN_05700 [Lactococcus lactis]
MNKEIIIILKDIQKDLHTIASSVQVKKVSPEEIANTILQEFKRSSANHQN